MGKKLGDEKVFKFRRSWDMKPEPINKESPYHPFNITTSNIPRKMIPETESLKDTYERVLDYFKKKLKKIN